MNFYFDIRATALFMLVIFVSGCTHRGAPGDARETPAGEGAHVLTDTNDWATDPYLTEDHLGNLVLCWTEKPRDGANYLLKYAVFDSASANFRTPVTVRASSGAKTSAESAGRVAFKSDGTVVALFGKRFDDPDNRFAGAIQYSLSTDQGASWSPPAYLHSDTSHSYGRGFFDIARLASGELGAVWLDGRYGEADTGSALFFTATVPGGGFGPDKMIGRSTCECCRTDLLVDREGIVHLAYRDILFPPDRMGRQVRDMVYTRSADNGASFRPPVRISVDNWEVEGCPHAGPSLASGSGGSIRAVWFTAGSGANDELADGADRITGSAAAGATVGAGVYQASLAKDDAEFSPRELLSSRARHPQLIDLEDGGFAIAWDETTTATHQHGHGAPNQGEAGHGASPRQAGSSAPGIVLQTSGPTGKTSTLRLTNGSYPAHHPVLAAPAPGKLLLAWVTETDGTSAIAYSLVDVPKP